MGEGGSDADDDPPDRVVVDTAARAATDLLDARIDRDDIRDLDVTVQFSDGILEVEVFLDAPEADVDESQVADDAALAARSAVDDLLE